MIHAAENEASLPGLEGEAGAGSEPIVWTCIRTHPKHEHIAAAQLCHVPGVEVFNPQLRLERQTRRGRMRSTESLFVNYVFVRFVIATTLERVRFTPSVKSVVQFGERIATIPDAIIEELRQTLSANADTIFIDAPLEGDEAEISSGPFQGERGTIVRVLPARERVEILLDVMGRSLPTEFRLSSIIFKHRTAAQKMLSVERETAVAAVP
jgi:transcriptional antiterminator RfaH